METGSRRNQYFVPGDGIEREVIQGDICKYLDHDATIKPGTYQGKDGYFLYAYRNLTSEMIADLKSDTVKWKEEKTRRLASQRSGHRAVGATRPVPAALDRYVDSATHEKRQRTGPSMPDTPSPMEFGGGPPPGRAPPPSMDYRQQMPSPYSNPDYIGQSSPSSGYMASSRSSEYPANYVQALDHGSARPAVRPGGFEGGYDPGYDPGYEHSRYPQEQPYYSANQGVPVHQARPYPPQQPQPAPPPQSRDPRYDYQDSRGGHIGRHGQPRQEPPYTEPYHYSDNRGRRR